MNKEQQKIKELHDGFQTACVDQSYRSNLAYRPEFISNNYKEGKKVLVSLEQELSDCEEFQISVAFITKSGITPLLQILEELTIAADIRRTGKKKHPGEDPYHGLSDVQ